MLFNLLFYNLPVIIIIPFSFIYYYLEWFTNLLHIKKVDRSIVYLPAVLLRSVLFWAPFRAATFAVAVLNKQFLIRSICNENHTYHCFIRTLSHVWFSCYPSFSNWYYCVWDLTWSSCFANNLWWEWDTCFLLWFIRIFRTINMSESQEQSKPRVREINEFQISRANPKKVWKHLKKPATE